MRVAAHNLRRRMRKCEAEESTQLTRLRQSIRDGRTQIATVHAENVIRQRTELVRLEAMLGPLVTLADRLKDALMKGPSAVVPDAIDTSLLADIQQAKGKLCKAQKYKFVIRPVARVEVDDLIAQLTEPPPEDGFATIASMQQDELMNRLRSLRK